MTAAESAHSLRRLRFPGELEAAFQAHYYRQILPTLRAGLVLLLLIVTAQGLLGWYYRSAPPATLLLSTSVRALICLGGLALTYRRGFHRYWQPTFALCVSGLALLLRAVAQGFVETPFLRDPAARQGFWLAMVLYAMVMTAGVLRLHFGWTALYQSALAAGSFWGALTGLEIAERAVFQIYGYSIVPALSIVLFASYTYERLERAGFLNNHLLEIERDRSETLLRNTLPDPIVDRLKAGSGLIADDHAEVTVLFGDIAGFTPWSQGRPAHAVLDFLNEVFSRFDRLVEAHGLEKIKTVGDCYMVVAGAPLPRADHVEAAARLALAMQAEVRALRESRGYAISFRIGLHTGPLAAGVIGEKRFLYDVWGDTVNTASRLESHGVPGAIQVSALVAERLRNGFALRRRGEVELKGKGVLETFFLEGELAPTGEPAGSGPSGSGARESTSQGASR